MRTKCPPKFALALSAALAGFVGYIILQDGSTAFDIRQIYASRTSLNDSGQAIFRVTR